MQKRLDRKIKRELKHKLNKSEYMMMNAEESYSLHKSNQNLTDSYSIYDSKLSSSVHSSRRPKVRQTIATTQIVNNSDDQSGIISVN
jgi:hypothetical protein